MSRIHALIETQEFATLPPVAAKVLSMLEDDNADIRDISKAIEADPALTLKLLRVANSPLYATRNEVNTIHQAILTLGLSRLMNIVLGVSIFSKFIMNAHSQAKPLMEAFWWHASCTGIVAKSLATKIHRSYKENEFIGGLLHDIGKLAMLQFDVRKYYQVVELVEYQGLLDVEAEMRIFGATHAEVGAEIAKLWKLPQELTSVISGHTVPSESERFNELIAVVRLADLLCEVWGAGFFEGVKYLSVAEHDAWKTLANANPTLQTLDVEKFTFELEADYKKSTEFLNILVSPN